MASIKDQDPRTLVVYAADPAIEVEGSLYYNSTTDTVRKSDGVVWTDVGGTAGTQRTFSFFAGG